MCKQKLSLKRRISDELLQDTRGMKSIFRYEGSDKQAGGFWRRAMRYEDGLGENETGSAPYRFV
jgi:hypothetical protein